MRLLGRREGGFLGEVVVAGSTDGSHRRVWSILNREDQGQDD